MKERYLNSPPASAVLVNVSEQKCRDLARYYMGLGIKCALFHNAKNGTFSLEVYNVPHDTAVSLSHHTDFWK